MVVDYLDAIWIFLYIFHAYLAEGEMPVLSLVS